MERVVVRMDSGDVLEFTGVLVARSSREVARDGRHSTVFEYRLYRTEAGGYVLALDSFEKVRARSFFLRFNSRDDARDYVSRDEGGAALARALFDPAGDGGGERP